MRTIQNLVKCVTAALCLTIPQVNASAPIRDLYASTDSTDFRKYGREYALKHKELHAMSAPVATFCILKAAKPFLTATAQNYKAQIVEVLRKEKKKGDCFPLKQMPTSSMKELVWRGEVMDDGEPITLVVFQSYGVQVLDKTTLMVKSGVFVCWYTDTTFRCF